MAIRRGSLNTPTSASDVFASDTKNSTGDGKTPLYRSSFPVDMALLLDTDGGSDHPQVHPRLTTTKYVRTNTSAVQQSGTSFTHDFMNGFRTDTSFTADTTRVCHMWKRAPGYFDSIVYTGDGVNNRTVTHNLGVVPEMIWVKSKSSTENWAVYHKNLDSSNNPETHYISLNSANLELDNNEYWNDTAPTASVFTVGTQGIVNNPDQRYLAFLFATLPGISKVGSYTGNGSTQNIDCGFSNGAKFVLIKRTDANQDWGLFDTTRGIVAGNDPFAQINSTSADTTGYDVVDPHSAGFGVGPQLLGIVNDNGGNYIFYAVAA